MSADLFANVHVTEEVKARAMAATTPEEVLAIAREEGIDLTEEQLEAINGGMDWASPGPGDTRDDIDEALVSEAFRRGEDLGDDVE